MAQHCRDPWRKCSVNDFSCASNNQSDTVTLSAVCVRCLSLTDSNYEETMTDVRFLTRRENFSHTHLLLFLPRPFLCFRVCSQSLLFHFLSIDKRQKVIHWPVINDRRIRRRFLLLLYRLIRLWEKINSSNFTIFARRINLKFGECTVGRQSYKSICTSTEKISAWTKTTAHRH